MEGNESGGETMMLHTTFNLCHNAGACMDGYRKLAKALGGVETYGRNTPIPLSKIVESNGLADALWTLRCMVEAIEVTHNLLIEFACRCAEHVLINYEKLYPDDKRPRLAIEAARVVITDKSAYAAADAAYAAANAAYAAANAAYAAADAAYAAEKDWQTQQFLELLNAEAGK
jgi:hypothetical protein